MMPYRSNASRSNQLAEFQMPLTEVHHRQLVVGAEHLQPHALIQADRQQMQDTQNRAPS
jgi:hypothetical protein